MVSRRILLFGILLISIMCQTGCCCHRRHVFRVQNSACCTPAPRAACCEPANSYYRGPAMPIQAMPAPPLAAPNVIMQQAR